MAAYTSSPAYARQIGKPVVGIWGFGFNDSNHPWSAATCLSVVNWFKSQGCYVMGGVPTCWRTGVSDSRPGYLGTYHAFNMLSPWMVGRIGTAADSDSFSANVNVPDQADCNANGSMFDEYGEGNQIAETAPDSSMVPVNSGLLALNEDGTACSSDYYLRLTADGGRMLKGQIALTATRPTSPRPLRRHRRTLTWPRASRRQRPGERELRPSRSRAAPTGRPSRRWPARRAAGSTRHRATRPPPRSRPARSGTCG